ncbi:MAG: OprD family outer membrane porin [Gammaproteobacteria bacterium]
MHFEETTIKERRISLLTRTVLAMVVLVLFAISSGVHATESIAVENTAPNSAVESLTPLDEALTQPEAEEPVLLKELPRQLEDMPPILRDATFKINLRAYHFDREALNDQRDYANSLGGEIFFETGKFMDIAQVGVSYYSSNLFGNSENPGRTGLVAPNGDDINILGQAHLLLGDADGWQASLYRRAIKVPYLDTNDSRMIPQTHESYFISRYGERSDFGFGHFTRTKQKNSERFIPMSEAAGALDTDKGLSVAGGKVEILDHASVGLFNYYGWDTFNTLYAEANWASYILRSLGTKVGLQYTDQRSVGDQLVGEFHTSHLGIKASGSVKGVILTLAYTQVDDEASIRFPWGGFPSYNWGMLESFNRPGERAWRLGVSFSGTAWGQPAWSGFVNITHGYDARVASSGAAAPDVNESAITLDYKPKSDSLKGLWLRFRTGRAEFDDDTEVTNVRLIVNYSLPIL